jgi:hypothetical protein
MKKQL